MSRIELTNVTKRWGQFYAVDNLSMVIEDNAFVTLLGPSGCGKTTTLRMIAGLETPTSGRITIDGVPVFDSQRGINVSANKRKVGFLFQNYALWPNMTVYQNISFGLTNIKEEMDEIDFDARAAARMIEILQKPQDVVRAINECVDKKKKLNMDKAYLRLIDLYGKKSLHILLNELNKIPGIYWIRLMYCYPEEIYDELIETIRDEKKICHYLDIPIQHASDRILKRMGRRTSKQELIDIVGKLRKEIPDIVLRTTLITGFPGETEEDHEELKEFVDEMEFDRLGVFTYSPEENTPAAEMADQVPEEVKEERRDELMELQQEISYDRGQDRIGQELLVMIEGKVADENAYVGRSYRDAPDIDGLVFVNTDTELVSGDFVKVRITGAYEYDLIGELM